MKIDRSILLVAALTLIGFGLRIYKVEIPDRTIGDEVYYVPAARSILGQNEDNVPRDRISAHPPLGKMIIAAGMLLFGDNPFGWRVMSVVAGTLVIPVFYLLVKRLVEGRKELTSTPLLATFIISFETLGFYFSRVARIDIFMMLFFLVGVYFLLDKHPVRRFLAAPFFAASFLSKEVAVLLVLPALVYVGVKVETKKDRRGAKKTYYFDFKTFVLLAAATAASAALLWYFLEWVVLTPTRPNLLDRVLVMFSRLDITNPAAVGRSEIWMWFFNQPVTRAAATLPGVRIDFSTVVVGPLLNPGLKYAYIVQPSWTLILLMVPVSLYAAFKAGSDSIARFAALSWFGTLLGWILVNVLYRGLMYLFYVLTLLPPIVVGLSWVLGIQLFLEKKTKSVKWFAITLVFLLLHTANFLALYPVPFS
ncbi:MAG: glycosyltransferase family 39 protein [Candidatus Caldarchaeum sp.]|nr:glycosyltransferase family 39 protein [Candidatus Caldarchaeum sp.]